MNESGRANSFKTDEINANTKNQASNSRLTHSNVVNNKINNSCKYTIQL